nr:uncharacterized protein LOC111420999 isoform X1 [Onthophagus taurus]
MSICLESDSEIQKFNNNNSIDNDNMNISQIDSGQAKQDDVDYDDNINVQELAASEEANNTIDVYVCNTSSTSEMLQMLPSGSTSTAVTMDSLPSASRPSSSTTTSKTAKSKKKASKLDNYIDTISVKEEDSITQAIAEFFFACNIPFNVIESKYFDNLIKKLRPAYAKRKPGRKTLSSTLLDSVYNNLITETKFGIDQETVVLIDGWKNTSSNSKIITCTLQTVGGQRAFLNAWDLTGEAETAQKLVHIINEAIDLAKRTYHSQIYAIISDNASAMVRMGKDMNHCLWHSTCNSHTANLLAKDVQDKECTNSVTTVLKEFKQADNERAITEKGGTKIKLPCETRWCSYQKSYKCLLDNLRIMRVIAAETDSTCKRIKSKVVSLLFDEDFIDKVRNQLSLYEPICQLINNCQSQDASIADAVHFWLELTLPDNFKDKYSAALAARKKMALNVYALTAYYLHPVYENKKLNSEHLREIHAFLFKILSAQGCEEWDNYERNVGIFPQIKEKNITKPLLFWRMAEMENKELPQVALKLLKMPASSGEIERVFSNWGYIHSSIRNRLGFEKSKKLVYIYYTLKIKDNCQNYDWDESEVETTLEGED